MMSTRPHIHLTLNSQTGSWTLTVEAADGHGALTESTLREAFEVDDPDDTPAEQAYARGVVDGIESLVLALACAPNFAPASVVEAIDTALEAYGNAA